MLDKLETGELGPTFSQEQATFAATDKIFIPSKLMRTGIEGERLHSVQSTLALSHRTFPLPRSVFYQRRRRELRKISKMVGLQSSDSLMVAFNLEEVQTELPLLDEATMAAKRTLLLLLLGAPLQREHTRNDIFLFENV